MEERWNVEGSLKPNLREPPSSFLFSSITDSLIGHQRSEVKQRVLELELNHITLRIFFLIGITLRIFNVLQCAAIRFLYFSFLVINYFNDHEGKILN